MRQLFFLLWIALIICIACEKDVSIHLPQQVPQLVVEGKFDNDDYPLVVLTRSLNFFSQIDPAAFSSSFVHNAIVTVSDSSRTMMLKEQSIDVGGGVEFFAYAPDISRAATNFKGKVPGVYTLRINVDNKIYESVTTIPPQALRLDSIWWTKAQVKNDTNKARLWIRVTDPPVLGNYARYFTKRNSEPFLPGLNSVVDDQVVNGTTFEIALDAGVNKNKKIDIETYAFFNRGDTVTLKFCNIDKATYDFWKTLDFAYNSNGNPFSSPTKILGNVPGALGYWGGYAITYKTIIISK